MEKLSNSGKTRTAHIDFVTSLSHTILVLLQMLEECFLRAGDILVCSCCGTTILLSEVVAVRTMKPSRKHQCGWLRPTGERRPRKDPKFVWWVVPRWSDLQINTDWLVRPLVHSEPTERGHEGFTRKPCSHSILLAIHFSAG
jgi:hypothetical protein